MRENTGRISDTMPMAGRMRMYTSGWPNSQNRCCHNTGSAPLVKLKKFVPNRRSNRASNNPTVRTGRAKIRRNCTTRVIHTKSGIRMKLIPGARMLTTVTARFTAETVEAIPRITRPSR